MLRKLDILKQTAGSSQDPDKDVHFLHMLDQ